MHGEVQIIEIFKMRTLNILPFNVQWYLHAAPALKLKNSPFYPYSIFIGSL
jgi:hypothetical protein